MNTPNRCKPEDLPKIDEDFFVERVAKKLNFCGDAKMGRRIPREVARCFCVVVFFSARK